MKEIVIFFAKLSFVLILLFLFTNCNKEKEFDRLDLTINSNDSSLIVKPKLKYLALGDSYTI
jgi:hypothetical protein